MSDKKNDVSSGEYADNGSKLSYNNRYDVYRKSEDKTRSYSNSHHYTYNSKNCRNNCYKRDKEGKYSSIDYYSYRCWLFWIQNFLIKGELMLFTLAPNLKNILF